jgi:hypothetical protein
VQHDRRAVRRLDHDVRFCQRAFVIAALGPRGVGSHDFAPHGFLGVEHRLELFPLDLDRGERAARLLGGVRREGGHRLPRVLRLVHESLRLARTDRRPYSRQLERAGELDSLHSRVGIRRAQQDGMQHSRQLHVGRVARLSAHTLGSVLADRVAADDRLRSGGPLRQRILLDDEPHLFEAALDFLLGADQPCQCRIASSMRG